MRKIEPGGSASFDVVIDGSHTAAALGNTGVEVVSTTALILFLEDASHRAILESYEEGEASVGTVVNVRHVGAAPASATIRACARITAVVGRRLTFAVEARQGEKLLMEGTHERFVVDLRRFLEKQGLLAPEGR